MQSGLMPEEETGDGLPAGSGRLAAGGKRERKRSANGGPDIYRQSVEAG